ncbi:hypothetical protein Q8A73_014134 [Channa argus]|nr:hypothetical protein Q8A73_014134 [Channa argus]
MYEAPDTRFYLSVCVMSLVITWLSSDQRNVRRESPLQPPTHDAAPIAERTRPLGAGQAADWTTHPRAVSHALLNQPCRDKQQSGASSGGRAGLLNDKGVWGWEKTSVVAREAVCSSTHQANGMRPLYANEAGRSLIGCENGSVSIIPAREQLKGEEEREKEEERGHICPRAIHAQSSPVCAEHVPKLADYSRKIEERKMSGLKI